MANNSGITVAILMGGVSSEREVSLHSGQGIAQGLRQAGYGVIEAVVDTPDLAAIHGKSVDVAFIALHGAFGEDGTVQRLLEDAGTPYTGSGPDASFNALDKTVSKKMFIRAGVPTAPYLVIDAGKAADERRAFELLGPRVVVKPAAQGSSIGVSIVGRHGFAEAVAKAVSFDGRAIVEPFIKGREVTVGIFGDRTLPIVEMRPRGQFFDYEAKYQYGQTEYIVDPDLPSEVAGRVTQAGMDAFKCLGCRDLGRVDIMVSDKGEVFVLEVNTIPGFTETSLVPMAARAVGVDFANLCKSLVEMALKRSVAAKST